MRNRNKALIITGAILLVVALIVFLVGGAIAGWDFVAFFKSQTFMWICILVGIYVIAVVAIIIYDKIKSL